MTIGGLLFIQFSGKPIMSLLIRSFHRGRLKNNARILLSKKGVITPSAIWLKYNIKVGETHL